MVTDEMVKAAAKELAKQWVIYPMESQEKE
jgi:hypothetical protein